MHVYTCVPLPACMDSYSFSFLFDLIPQSQRINMRTVSSATRKCGTQSVETATIPALTMGFCEFLACHIFCLPHHLIGNGILKWGAALQARGSLRPSTEGATTDFHWLHLESRHFQLRGTAFIVKMSEYCILIAFLVTMNEKWWKHIEHLAGLSHWCQVTFAVFVGIGDTNAWYEQVLHLTTLSTASRWKECNLSSQVCGSSGFNRLAGSCLMYPCQKPCYSAKSATEAIHLFVQPGTAGFSHSRKQNLTLSCPINTLLFVVMFVTCLML